MNIWFSSDWHLGHTRIIDLSGRPFDSVDEMNNTILDNINSFVKRNDMLFLLGDICMGSKTQTIPLLTAIDCIHVYAFAGNHDPFSRVYEKRDWKRNEWIHQFVNHGVYPIEDGVHTFNGVPFNMSHFPYSGDHTDDERFTKHRPVDDGRWLIHGHVHEAWQVNGRQINVGVDAWNFQPVSLDQIMEIVG